jgi:hypothetical protein
MAVMSDWALPEAGAASPPRRLPSVAVAGVAGPQRRAVSLRPATPSQLVDDGCRVLRRLARTLIPLVLACTLPIEVAQALVTRSQLNGSDDRAGAFALGLIGVRGGSFLTAGSASLLLFGVARLLVQTLLAGAVAVVVVGERFGTNVSVSTALKKMLRKTPALFVVWFCVTASVTVAGCAIVGGYALGALWFVTVPALMIEGLGPFAAMGRSWRMGARRFWAMLGVSMLSGLVALLVGFAFSLLALIPVAFSLLSNLSWLFAGVAAQVNDLVTIPIAAATAAFAYLDLRIRTEGLDLQVARVDLVGNVAPAR